MITLYLERTRFDGQVNGVLKFPDGSTLQTLERPWLDNKPMVSCIPDGMYKIEPHVSPKFGKCYIISGGTVGKDKGVRTHCLFHAANYVHQLNGCIALGDSWNGTMLLNSRKSVEKFMTYLNNQPAMLSISGIDQNQ